MAHNAPARWNSTVTMLKSLLHCNGVLQNVLGADEATSEVLLSGAETHKLRFLGALRCPFGGVTDLTQSDSYVTSSCSLLLVRQMQEDSEEGTVEIERADGNVEVTNLSEVPVTCYSFALLIVASSDRSILRSCIARSFARASLVCFFVPASATHFDRSLLGADSQTRPAC